MANQNSIKVVEIEKAIKLIVVVSFALLVAAVWIWTIYSFGYSRGEDHGSTETMQALTRNAGIGGGSCTYVNGNYICGGR